MSSYYRELADLPEHAQRDGWRHRLEQWLRFEVVLRGLAVEEGASIVDLGCGTGELAGYLSPFRPSKYLGVERREEALETARAKYGDVDGVEFIAADFADPGVSEHGPFDYAIAIGTMVDGGESSEGERRQALALLIQRLESLGKKGWALVVLDEESLQKDLIRRLEPSLKGARREEIRELTSAFDEEVAVDSEALPTDLFVLRKRGEEKEAALRRIAGDIAHLEVLRRYEETQVLSSAEEAWFWMISLRLEKARSALVRVPADDPWRQILEARLEA